MRTRNGKNRAGWAVLSMALMVPTQQAVAAACDFNSPAGNWNDAGNWSCGNVPTGPGADSATIAAGQTVTVDVAGGNSIRTLDNAGTIDIDANLLNLQSPGGTTNTGTINVGAGPNPNNATLDIATGHNLDNTGGNITISADSLVNQRGSRITGGTLAGSGRVVVFSSGNNFLDGVTLNADLDMATNANSREQVANGLTLNGTVDINQNGILSFDATQTLDGTGSIVLGNSGASNRIDLNDSGTTTFGSDVTVRGQNGTIGQGTTSGMQTLVNEGTISADVAGGTITITDSAVDNNGTLSAQNGGTLVLQSDVTGGASGQIVAGASSQVRQEGVTLSGTINTSGSGLFTAISSGFNRLDGITLNGDLDMASVANSRERVTAGGLVLNGVIDINQNGFLTFEGDGGVSTASGATIVLGDTGPSNRIDLNGSGTTTFGSDVTVRGQNGTIGQGTTSGMQTLVNEGTISADVAGGTITITDSAVDNNGTLSAQNGGTLVLQSDVTGGASGQIVAGASSQVRQEGVTLSGTINTSGSGLFTAISSGFNRLDGVTLNGDLDMASVANSRERVTAGGLVLNGVIDINQNGFLTFEGDGGVSTASGATIVLGDTGPSNRIDLNGSGTTTFGSNVTVRGQNGTIGLGTTSGMQTLVNEGTVSADVAGGTITIRQSDVTNNGTLSAQNGGTLVLQSDVTGGVSGQILAGVGSQVRQEGVTLSGTINTSGSGLFTVDNSGFNRLDGVTLNGDLDMASVANSRERVTTGGLVLNGVIDINQNGFLTFEGDGGVSTASGATIVLGDTGPSNRIDLNGSGTTTFGSDVTVRGQNGTIGQGTTSGMQTLVNEGTVSADVAGGTITIRQSDVTNNGTLSAQNGGTLVLQSDVTGGVSGQILAGVGSQVRQEGVTLSGTINTSGGALFTVDNSSFNRLDGVTLNGDLDMASVANSRERVTAGGLVLNGDIDINQNGFLTFEGDGGVSTTSGATIVLGNSGASNRINLNGTGTTTFGSNVTVRGQNGTIGLGTTAGTQTLVNEGTINSDSGGLIRLDTDGTLTNNGTLRAQDGTLTMTESVAGSGTLQVDAAGVMNLANGGNTQGTLQMGATGASLDIGNGNLTINTDYTNTAAGSGDGFDRRAGVSGAGQVVAGGDAAQAITGSDVTDGATPSATLTINNVRVGDTTLSYQVANTGTTGPSLRGAIQTGVNGGNITDARLTGSGVTAGNYNTGAPGSDTGDLEVTFTAASAGALAPLSGQAVNLRSNFENIADQRLDIVLGAGAAAFNAAVGDAAPDPVMVANQRVGGSNTSTLTVSNLAATGSFSESLNASFGASSGEAANNGGTVSLLAAGDDDSSAMQVSVDTATAGAKSGTVTIDYESDGTGTSGLGTINAGSQVVAVSGDVYRLAEGSATPTPVNFGNRHLNEVVSQQLTVQNSALADGFSESLNASFSSTAGDATSNGGSVNLLGAGASEASAMSIGLDTSTAGDKSGSATLAFESDGDGTSGLSAVSAGGQTIDVTGSVYRLASANTLGAVNFGNVHVGDVVQQALSVTNTAVDDGFSESLNASFGASSDARITSSGSITQLAAGASDSANLVVGLDTGAAGLVSGTQTVDFASDGTGTSGLGITALPSQTFAVSGDITTTGSVFRLASASPATPNPVDFGNVRIATLAEQALSITNTAVDDGFSEKLNASISSDGAPVTASGSFNLLGPQDTDSGSLRVGIDTSTAGVKAGSATIALVSDGTGTSDLGTTALAPQSVAVSGTVYRLADPTLNTTSVDLVARRGDSAPSAAVSVSNQSPDSFTEGLNASFGATPSAFTGSGTIANLAAQGTDASSLQLALDTATAGSFGGSAQLDFESTGAGTTGAADISVGSASVALSGSVYEAAVAQLDTTVVDFGIVHRGEIVAARNVSVTNAAPMVALNDTLHAQFINMPSGPFSGSGSVAGLTADSTDASSLLVGLDTSSAGVFSSATDNLRFASQNGEMADLALGDSAVTLRAQVNEFVNPTFFKDSGDGTLSGGGLSFDLDFGTLTEGGSAVGALLRLTNDVSGPADLLDGFYDLLAVDDFLLGGFGDVVDLAAGDSQGGLSIELSPLLAGSYTDTIVLEAIGHNASGFRSAFGDVTLTIRARVAPVGTAVPEPATLLLLLVGVALLWRRAAVVRPTR